ncbi:MAG: hypothetical protein DWQ04_00660 [Chloroflexi bacterium]|nr:MAG: hypothetical protein DWQ04_00660 [Chloroflexota bacterium]
MPKQNRVTPTGDIIATTARGSLMGNRGILHNARQELTRPFSHKAWIICRLNFKGRKRSIMQPNRYTELFFLDEATALAAGHRPCFECQRERAIAFRDAWAAANPDLVGAGPVKMGDIDTVLHTERLTQARLIKDRRKQTYQAEIEALPNGVFVLWRERPFLIWNTSLYPWTPSGYETPPPQPANSLVTVLTPRSIVNTLIFYQTSPRLP